MLRHSNSRTYAVLDQVLSGLGRKARGRAEKDEHDQADGYIPFKVRFLAWWEGLEPADILTRMDQDDEAAAKPSPKALVIDGSAGKGTAEGAARRTDVLQRIWGEGCHIPGGADFTLSLAQACQLEPDMKVLDLNAGMGAAARDIASKLGVTVAGKELDSELAKVGMALSEQADLAEAATIEPYDPEELKLPRGAYDCILAREVLFLINDKLDFLRMLRDALKVRGQLTFTDYVVTDDANSGRELAQWREAEPRKVQPWTTDRYLMVMGELSLEVQTFEDITPQFIRLALSAWDSFKQELGKAGVNRAFANAMLVEAELWQRRIQLMKSGDLRVLQVHASKKETATMSDW